MWIAMSGLLGLALIVFVLALLSARASRKYRPKTHSHRATLEMQTKQAQRTSSMQEREAANSGMNDEQDYTALLTGAGQGRNY